MVCMTMLMTVSPMNAQKNFTLEDLNFGGTNYRNMVPENRWTAWWGDQLVRLDVDACYLVDKANGKENRLFDVSQINQWIAPTKDILFEYKANPDNYKGNVADISTVIRVALTSSSMTPDLYEIMKLLGKDRIIKRINKFI